MGSSSTFIIDGEVRSFPLPLAKKPEPKKATATATATSALRKTGERPGRQIQQASLRR